MAKIGLNNFRYAILTEGTDGTATYAGAIKPGKAVSCSFSPDTNSATLYADDALAEADTSFAGGTVTMGIDDSDLETQAALLGHTITDGTLERNAEDVSPYVGLGRVVTKLVGGKYEYKAEILYKVKFAEPSQEDNTKGASVEFATPEFEGTVATLADGNWSKAKIFDTQAEAIAFIEDTFAAPASA